jgi:hypothetical protein
MAVHGWGGEARRLTQQARLDTPCLPACLQRLAGLLGALPSITSQLAAVVVWGPAADDDMKAIARRGVKVRGPVCAGPSGPQAQPKHGCRGCWAGVVLALRRGAVQREQLRLL